MFFHKLKAQSKLVININELDAFITRNKEDVQHIFNQLYPVLTHTLGPKQIFKLKSKGWSRELMRSRHRDVRNQMVFMIGDSCV